MSCFQGLFFCPEAASLLLHNFCFYHITPQGHEVSYDGSLSLITLPTTLLMSALILTWLMLSTAVRSGSNSTWCACAICWWPRRSNRWCPWFLQVLYLESCWILLTIFSAYRRPLMLSLFIFCPCSLGSVMCLGVTAGAYVLTLFAVSVNYHEHIFQLFALWALAKGICYIHCHRQNIGRGFLA
jgi:hypothetical protein